MAQTGLFADASPVDGWGIPRALVVRVPWASMIVQGTKSWEIRGAATTIRGTIAIAAKGTGTIVGVCSLVDVRGPLSADEYAASRTLRGAGGELSSPSLPYGRTYAWVLSDPRPVIPHIRYPHPSGAVIWVRLPMDTQEKLRAALER